MQTFKFDILDYLFIFVCYKGFSVSLNIISIAILLYLLCNVCTAFVYYFFKGIYTGSVYKDYGLLKNGFPGESIINSSVSIVKTHEWGSRARQRFDRAVLLIRSPGPAILAEFNRQSGGHIGFASPDRYRRNKGKCLYTLQCILYYFSSHLIQV